MSNTTKRILGNYNIHTINEANVTSGKVMFDTLEVNIKGNLVVDGTTTTVNSAVLDVADNTIVLNKGEDGAGITLGVAGMEIDRGTEATVGIRYNEATEYWEATDDGTIWYPLASGLGGTTIDEVWDDKTPYLGGDLIVNNTSRDPADTWKITSTDGQDVILDADPAGNIKIDHTVCLENQNIIQTGVTGYNKLYAKVPAEGGSGIFFTNEDNTTDELVSKTRAILYSIIF